jgi:CheY-like chemotaxis protein
MSATPVHVLVVDDDPDFTQSMSMLLELAGYCTVSAFDGRTAIELAQRHRPLVILSDLAMPGLDGYSLLRALRTEPACRHAFVVALSGWGGHTASQDARNAGFDAYFMKPCEHAELMNTVAAAVQGRIRQREAAGCGRPSAGGTG